MMSRRKLFITLILILFLFPFVSWYYLQRGLDWRKEAQNIMKGTTPFPEGQWKTVKDNFFSDDQLQEKVTLMARINCDNISEADSTLSKFYNQFKETKKAGFILLMECDTTLSPSGMEPRQHWYEFVCADSLSICAELFTAWPEGSFYGLVDREGIIRSYYAGRTIDEKKLLLEHMALLLPRERSEKVELKRGDRK